MKKIIRRVVQIQNLVPVLIVIGALLVPLGLHTRVGLTTDGIILALFSLLALDSVVARAGMLSDIQNDVSRLRTLYSQNQVPFFRSGFGVPSLAEAVGNAREVIFCGMTMGRTFTTFSELLRQRIQRGAKVKVVVTNPAPDSPGVSAAAKRSLNLDTAAEMAAHIQNTIAGVAKIYHKVPIAKRCNIELYLIDFPPSFSIVSVDGGGQNGTIVVELYGCKVDPAEDPAFYIQSEDGPWYGFFYQQALNLVNCGTKVDLAKSGFFNTASSGGMGGPIGS